jgi:hypothetical protein
MSIGDASPRRDGDASTAVLEGNDERRGELRLPHRGHLERADADAGAAEERVAVGVDDGGEHAAVEAHGKMARRIQLDAAARRQRKAHFVISFRLVVREPDRAGEKRAHAARLQLAQAAGVKWFTVTRTRFDGDARLDGTVTCSS